MAMVLVDDSPAAAAAIEYAANHVAAAGEPLYLVHVCVPNPIVVAGGPG
eukprot:CAMPEP_0119130654 /NCGR_PEP_ID=MMETSP1310-20130426/8343_1 /TAXON_ID=464262 /ORGANISM="Genus nov. species nov., Strain RCC2339" /LENGTH=48 /DNA_ID= /DNA_START= /DNA_END= /DNA_ORIENTATION=